MAEIFIKRLSLRVLLVTGFIKKAMFAGITAILSLSMITSASARQADSDWWFDIEFIAFKRDMLPGHPEDFSQTSYLFENHAHIDLFSFDLLPKANPTFRLASALPNCDITKGKQSMLPYPHNINTMFRGSNQGTKLNVEDYGTMATSLLNYAPEYETYAFIEGQQTWREMRLAPAALGCVGERVYQPFSEVPQEYFRDRPYMPRQPGVLGKDALNLEEFVTRVFGQRDITPLLYTAWRQQVVFGEQNAPFYRVVGGKRLMISEQDDKNLNQADIAVRKNVSENANALERGFEQNLNPSDSNLSRSDFINQQLSNLELALTEQQSVIWDIDTQVSEQTGSIRQEILPEYELDGLFKVYLDYVNRVPYLHIDSEFKHTRLDVNASGEQSLKQYPSKQRRRIISKQIHYFDHPAFGVIIRLQRYEPQIETDTTQVLQ